jgi:hypothetical protein
MPAGSAPASEDGPATTVRQGRAGRHAGRLLQIQSNEAWMVGGTTCVNPVASTGSQPGSAPAAGILRPAGRSGEAGLRTQCRQAMAGSTWRCRPASLAALSRGRSICLSAACDRDPPGTRRLHPHLQARLGPDHHRVSERRHAARASSDCLQTRQTHHQDLRSLRPGFLGTADAIPVNWSSIEMPNAKAKQLFTTTSSPNCQ